MTDVLDVGLNQAMVCCYAVPLVGPVAAAGISIVQAIINSVVPPDVPIGQFSTSLALADLGTKISEAIHAEKDEEDLAKIKSWQLQIRDAHDTTPAYAVTGAGSFLTDHNFNDTFGGFYDSEAKSEGRVKSLGNHFLARSAFHSLCQEWLDRLDAARHFEPMKNATLREEIHTRYVNSLKDALTYSRATVAMLDDSYRSAREKAVGTTASPIPGTTEAISVNLVRAQQLRTLRRQHHLQYASESDVQKFRQWILMFDTTLTGMVASTLPQAAPAVAAGTTTSAPTSVLAFEPVPAPVSSTTVVQIASAPATASGTTTSDPGTVTVLGPSVRPVSETRTIGATGVARFLFESAPTGGYVDALADSAVSPGPLVAQDAGSNLAGLYYRIGGSGLNGIFADRLDQAAQLDGDDRANADLVTAYDARWGAGAHAADAAGTPPRTDRLTSFLILLANGVPPIGESVYGVLYSVGPQLADKGIVDTDGYKRIYTDGLTAIAEWNRNSGTPFVNLRVALLSTGIYAGASAGPALNAQAAGLVVDAVVAAKRAHPELAGLTVLVNTNDTPSKDGDERVAFETAARARSIPLTRRGFDVPLS